MSHTNDYLSHIARFRLALQADADRMDRDDALLAHWYARFVAEGLNTGWSARQPLSGIEFCEALALLAESSGAFAFVVLQQFVANGSVPPPASTESLWPCVGVAFGHLRTPQGSSPVWNGKTISGTVPWMTGAGVFKQVVLGVRGPEKEEIYLLADATDRPAFRHSPPMDLIACSGTRTVRIVLSELPVDESAFLRTEPPGSLARNDANGVLYQTPLLVGCVRACLKTILNASTVESYLKARCEEHTAQLLERVRKAFTESTPEEGRQLRAELGDFAVRLARLNVMACGGAALATGHPAGRLYREALLYSLMAQTPAIVHQAFEEVFP